MRSLFGRYNTLAVVKGYGETIHNSTTQDGLGVQGGDPWLDQRVEALDLVGAVEFRSLNE